MDVEGGWDGGKIREEGNAVLRLVSDLLNIN